MAKLVDDISKFISKQTGIDNFLSRSSAVSFQPPWINDPARNADPFWKAVEIDPARWDKLYPYRLLVVDVSKSGNPIVSGAGTASGGVASQGVPGGGIEYVVTQTAQSGRWEMVLPITPQQLSIQDPFAISVTPTMRGIIEEHNGVKFKLISASGTTGIWPKRPTQGANLKAPTVLGSVLGSSLQSLNALNRSVEKLASSFTGSPLNRATKNVRPEASDAGDFSTGYYQAMYLGQFLERYVTAKKNPANKGWRLVFDIPKQNESFVVTPVAFSLNKNQSRPNEMLYSIQLKAWKRINLADKAQPNKANLPKLDANVLQNIVATIEETRRTLSAATSVVSAVRSDAQGLFEILRQSSLAVKDTAGLVFAIADLPKNIIQDARDTIQESLLNVQGLNRGPSTGNAAGASAGSSLNDPSITKATGFERAGQIVKSISDRSKANEGLSRDAVASGALGLDAAQQLNTDPLNNIFDNPEQNFDLFNSVELDSLTLTPQQQNAIDLELERVRSLTINDFRIFRARLLDLALSISNNYGAGDETYSYLYNRPEPLDRGIEYTIEENELVAAIFETIQSYDDLIATKEYDDNNIENPLEYVGGLANEAGIEFDSYPSKYLAPVPFGLSIEEIAARYLGDPDKWIEIATLNNLRAPYIDQDGFELPLLSNADGRQFNVNDSDRRLYVGQSLLLSSNNVPAFTRKIISIEKISDTNYLISVDGLDNLSTLTTAQGAKIKGYLPGTVNSQNQIFIPTNEPSQPDDRTFEIPFLDNPELTKISKVDFLLTDNFDLAITSTGDFMLANGITNLVQALKLKVAIKKDSLLRHLNFGLGIVPGEVVSDIETGTLITELNELIQSDERFDFIEKLNFSLNGPTLTISMSVRLANNNGILPITFEIRA